ncbi:MAG: DNA primase [Candidatus Omnitrophica bacterium]|nr:DNA primase [Candidatus Omnitrophota bacterium]
MPGIPQEILDEILSRVDIVEVISSFIPLKRAGRNFKALCPFHHEKTASFMVNPAKQIYHCFGCGVGGNAFNFLMRYERIEFPEAVEQLAKKAGVVIPKYNLDRQAESLNSFLYKINELAVIYYQGLLNSSEGRIAKEYLIKRGIRSETIESFKLGFAADKWDGLLNYLRSKEINLSLLEKSGLIIPKQGGGYYDRFRQRIIFPVYDLKNRIIAFGGRILPSREKEMEVAKYINSPETPIYVKGKNLFGLNFTKDNIAKFNAAVIVEGYMDFLTAYQEGIPNVIASQGTALTTEQLRLLKRYSQNVVMVFDADSAGQTATLRSLDAFLEEDMEVRVADLPSGFDPDTFIRKYGIKEFRKRIEGAKNLFDYKLDLLRSRLDQNRVEHKAKIANEMLATISKIKNAVLKLEYVRCLAEVLNLKEEALLIELKKIKPYVSVLQEKCLLEDKLSDIDPTEKLLLKLMLEEAELIEGLRGHLEPADFQNEHIARIVSVIFDLASQGRSIKPNKLMAYFSDEKISSFIGELLVPDDTLRGVESRQEIIHDCIRRLKNKRLRLKREELQEEIEIAQRTKDTERLEKLIQDFHQLTRGGI